MIANETKQIPILQWPSNLKRVKGILFIVHGIMEHSLRYAPVISEYNANGYHVASIELPGHGTFAYTNNALGKLPLRSGWRHIVDGVSTALTYLREYYPDLPIIVLGHSMGSFISRIVVAENSANIKGLILSGSTIDRSLLPRIGRTTAHFLSLFGGVNRPSRLLNALTFLGFNSHINPLVTEFDWLCTDHKVVDAYISDPKCGFICSSAYFAALFKLLSVSSSTSTLRNIPEHIPILIISGEKDPLSNGGRTLKKLHNELLKLKKNVETHIIPGERHEVLFGKSKNKAIHTVLTFTKQLQTSV